MNFVRIFAACVLAVVAVSCARRRPTADTTPDTKGIPSMATVHFETHSGPPAEAAVVVNNQQGLSMAILDLRTHQIRELGPERHQGSGPVWSEDGSYLLYQDEDRLMAYGGDPPRIFEFLDHLPTDAKYAVSWDSREVAVGAAGAILVVPAILPPDQTKVRRVALAPGCRIPDLLWAKDGSAVFALCLQGSNPEQSQLVRVGLSGRAEMLPSHGALSLLGWRNSADVMVISRPKEDGREPGFLSLTGAFQPFRPSGQPVDDALNGGETVVGYLAATEEILMAPQGEDGGDPLQMRRVSAHGGPARPWLAEFHKLTDLSVSHDGRWSMFVDPTAYLSEGPNGGDIYLTATGSDEAKLVLKGIPGDVSYLSPTPRPFPVRPGSAASPKRRDPE